jgi:hypothetical protein
VDELGISEPHEAHSRRESQTHFSPASHSSLSVQKADRSCKKYVRDRLPVNSSSLAPNGLRHRELSLVPVDGNWWTNWGLASHMRRIHVERAKRTSLPHRTLRSSRKRTDPVKSTCGTVYRSTRLHLPRTASDTAKTNWGLASHMRRIHVERAKRTSLPHRTLRSRHLEHDPRSSRKRTDPVKSTCGTVYRSTRLHLPRTASDTAETGGRIGD